jgi:hypothetical protein
VKGIKPSIHKVPRGHLGGYFQKVLSMCLGGIGWANCFRTHNELNMCPLGKYPLAPSVNRVANGIHPRRAEARTRTPLQPLVEYGGRLVPIGSIDSPVVTDTSDEVVPDSEAGDEVVDLAEEEEAQARDARYRGELTFHAEVEAARLDPAPEYEPVPEYTESE